MRAGTLTELSRAATIIPFAERRIADDGQNSSGVYAGTDEKGYGGSNPRATTERLRVLHEEGESKGTVGGNSRNRGSRVNLQR